MILPLLLALSGVPDTSVHLARDPAPATASLSASDPDSIFPAFLREYLEAYRRSRKEASRWIHPKLPYRTADNPGAQCVLNPPSRKVGVDPFAGGSEVVPPDTRIVIRRGIPAVKDPCDDAGPYRELQGFFWDPVRPRDLPRFGHWTKDGDLEIVVPWLPVPKPWRVMQVVFVAEGWDVLRMYFVWVDGGWHPWVDDHCTPCSA
jgi:hypothetical protein